MTIQRTTATSPSKREQAEAVFSVLLPRFPPGTVVGLAPHDGPIRLEPGEIITGVKFVRGGSLYGRFLFTWHDPILEWSSFNWNVVDPNIFINLGNESQRFPRCGFGGLAVCARATEYWRSALSFIERKTYRLVSNWRSQVKF